MEPEKNRLYSWKQDQQANREVRLLHASEAAGTLVQIPIDSPSTTRGQF